MIKFFRKIRQNSLSEGKTGKYLKYAIGEIILVVIGILLALQINNWNEARKNRVLEKEYLIRLLEDLEHDQKDLTQVITNNAINLILAEDALNKLGADSSILLKGQPHKLAYKGVNINNNEVTYKDSLLTTRKFDLKCFGEQITLLTEFRIFDLTQTTITDLTSTGNIEVIRDKKLRESIQFYYARMLSAIGNEESILKPHLDYLIELLKELGIPPNSRLSDSDLRDLVKNDHRLAMALYSLYDANRTLFNINYSRKASTYKQIQKIKDEIKAALELI
ncbi:DUF6090 family protein [Seonamhaeicola maritimus]|uniref:Uncharacterized protein n=1 Tax=Seonamhaeicola maritimus TaxID=2591822 RepID=A0A5C7GDU9_9FLAO|nr:DUF6090 family protein [Seonamhaeicola maritimus]TXG34562.1 hypothetical protein FUA22_18260 [Seonamhaeicola maritimus]